MGFWGVTDQKEHRPEEGMNMLCSSFLCVFCNGSTVNMEYTWKKKEAFYFNVMKNP